MEGWPLIAAAALMGLAGLPHCAAMCAAPCAAVTRGAGVPQAAFQLARVAGYAAAGAVAAAGIGALRDGLAQSAALRPLWTLVHLLALALGLWMTARSLPCVMRCWVGLTFWIAAVPRVTVPPAGSCASAERGASAAAAIAARPACRIARAIGVNSNLGLCLLGFIRGLEIARQ